MVFSIPQGKHGALRVSKGNIRRLKAGDVLLFGARPCACEGRAVPQNRQYEETIAGNRSRPFSHFALVLLTIISGVTTAAHLDLARADDCLAAPNSPAPKGSHWYYHLNRATQQKCWYVRSVERQPQEATVQTNSPNAAMPLTNVGQIRPTGPRNIDNTARQPEPIVAATDEPASGNVPTMEVAAAGPETLCLRPIRDQLRPPHQFGPTHPQFHPRSKRTMRGRRRHPPSRRIQLLMPPTAFPEGTSEQARLIFQ